MTAADQQMTIRVIQALTQALNVGDGEISAETQFGDLPQWDSMGHMEVMVALEKDFGVEINAETITELVSVAAICTHLEEQADG